jgi:hypothetical protein
MISIRFRCSSAKKNYTEAATISRALSLPVLIEKIIGVE